MPQAQDGHHLGPNISEGEHPSEEEQKAMYPDEAQDELSAALDTVGDEVVDEEDQSRRRLDWLCYFTTYYYATGYALAYYSYQTTNYGTCYGANYGYAQSCSTCTGYGTGYTTCYATGYYYSWFQQHSYQYSYQCSYQYAYYYSCNCYQYAYVSSYYGYQCITGYSSVQASYQYVIRSQNLHTQHVGVLAQTC